MQSKNDTSVVIEAVIIRADGSEEKLGVIASSGINTCKNILRKVKKNG